MNSIVYEILPDDNIERCDRCRSAKYPRLAFGVTPTLLETGEVTFPKGAPRKVADDRKVRTVLCVMCLANAIQTVTGWDMQSIILRYASVSPRFGSVSVKAVRSLERIKRGNPPPTKPSTKYKQPKGG